MCGICGFKDNKIRLNRERILQQMNRLLTHRGPDDEGYYLNDDVGLAMRRLSVIDLVTGGQPVHNEDQTIWIVFNGEIYNFKELRAGLEKKGHKFYTNSDTEIIVHLYEDMGQDCVRPLNGMFSFAIWDSKGNKFILARDRIGIKPLYYTLAFNGLIFASELKAIMAHPNVTKNVDMLSLRKYLSYEYVPCPRTILKGINKLPAGHMLIYKDKQAKLIKYWDLNFAQDSIKRGNNIKAYEEQFLHLLKQSVKRRLISDVPLGVFLSGGIDSSSIASLMCQLGVKDVKSFSIGFNDRSFDESNYAKKVSQFLGISHSMKNLDTDAMLKFLPKVAGFLDEPFGDASVIPTYLLSKFTRENVTVALSGEGGDELFCGYPTYQAHRVASIYQRVPKPIRNFVANRIVKRLPTSLDNFSLDFKAKRFISGMDYNSEMRHCVWMGALAPTEADFLISPDFKNKIKDSLIYNELDGYLADCSGYNLMQRIQRLDTKLYLQDDLLTKADRASMACSLEVRVPFLDHTLVEFAASLPVGMKMRGLTTKYILKRAMKKYLPPDIINRSKKGFGIPVAEWIKSNLKTLVLDVFSKGKVQREGFFDYLYIHKLLEDHFQGKSDNRKLIWTLLMFELWYKNFMEGTDSEKEIIAPLKMS